MSKYTTQVRWICETAARRTMSEDDIETASPTRIIQAAAPFVFNFDFPVYDEKYRLPLEIKILRHYYQREISEETVAAWKLRLEDKLNIIMPYFNELYKTTLYEFNPLYDVDYKKEGNREENGRHTNTKAETVNIQKSRDVDEHKYEQNNATENSSGRRENQTDNTMNQVEQNESNGSNHQSTVNLFSDTPQGSLEIFGIEDPPEQTVMGNSWLTTAERDESNGSGESTSDTTTHNVSQGNEEENTSSTIVKDTVGSVTNNTTDNSEQAENRSANDQGTVTNLNEYVEHVSGKMYSGSYSKLIKEFRETIVNIDEMIINALDGLFFGLWN